MAWNNDTHKKLRDVASYLWPDSRDCRRLVADSLIDATRINWDEPPNLRWQSVILEAEKQNTLYRLVPVLLKEYPENRELIAACAPWVVVPEDLSAKKKKVVPVNVAEEFADTVEEMPVTLESIRADLTIMSKELAELKRWRIALSTMSALNQPKEQSQ